jgi:hypothetical protein
MTYLVMWKIIRIFVKHLLITIIVIMVSPMNTDKNIIFLYTKNSVHFVREVAGHTKGIEA